MLCRTYEKKKKILPSRAKKKKEANIMHYLPTVCKSARGTLCEERAAVSNAHRRVRVVGHHCGYDGSLDSIRGDHASVH